MMTELHKKLEELVALMTSIEGSISNLHGASPNDPTIVTYQQLLRQGQEAINLCGRAEQNPLLYQSALAHLNTAILNIRNTLSKSKDKTEN